MKQQLVVNPHLEGDEFLWAGNSIGILLVHGFSATTAEVRPLATVLHKAGYTVAGPLLPGHKTIPQELNQVSWQDWVKKIETTYLQLQESCNTVIVGGESMGGLLSLYMAIHKPEISGLLLYAPALKLTMRTIDRIRLYLSAPFLPWVTPLPGPRTVVDERWQGYPVRPMKGIIQLLKLQKEVAPRLSKIKQPALVCQGRLDTTVHPDVPEMISDGIQSTKKETHWFRESSHCVILDREFDDVTKTTLEFLERIIIEPN
jgi:carboxylesterase